MSENNNKRTANDMDTGLKNLKKVNLSDIAPVSESEEEQVSLLLPTEDNWNSLNQRLIAESNALAQKKKEIEYEESLEIEDDESDDEFADLMDDEEEEVLDEEYDDELTSDDTEEYPKVKFEKDAEPVLIEEEQKKVVSEPVKKSVDVKAEETSSDDYFDDIDDFSDLNYITGLEDEKITKEEAEKLANEIKHDVKNNIKPVTNAVDFSKFKISKSVSKTPGPVLDNMAKTNSNTFTWYYTSFNGKEIPITMREFTGIELLKLNRNSITEGTDIAQFMRTMLQTIYDHIISPKPETMTEWAKTIPSISLDDLFFTIFGATYSKSNHIYLSCEKCDHSWMTESLPILSLVKDKTSSEVNEIFNRVYTEEEIKMVEEEIIQVTDDLAFSIKMPSLYSSIIEINSIPEAERNKMADILPTMMCISDIYYINRDTMTLEKIALKTLKNPVKSMIARYRQLKKFIDKLSPDQSAELDSGIGTLLDKGSPTTYVMPATTCPNCGAEIEEVEVSGEYILFIRHRLGAMRN